MRLNPVSRVAALLLLCGSLLAGNVLDGSFESGTLSSWSTFGDVGVSPATDIGDPVEFTVLPHSGDFAATIFGGVDGIAEEEIVSILNLDNLEIFQNAGPNTGVVAAVSVLWQSFAGAAGQALSFQWNFVTEDYPPFDDWVFFAVSLDGGPATIFRLASISETFPGREEDDVVQQTGWQQFSFSLPANASYTIFFGAVNVEDTTSDPELWIDSVSLSDAAAVPEPSVAWLMGLPLLAMALARRRRPGNLR